MALRMISGSFNVSDALLQEETARDLLAGIADQHARTTIAMQYPGYAAGALHCLGIYHYPDTKRPKEQTVMAMYFYALIRAPLTA
jgi:hypothetical protein